MNAKADGAMYSQITQIFTNTTSQNSVVICEISEIDIIIDL